MKGLGNAAIFGKMVLFRGVVMVGDTGFEPVTSTV